MYLQVTTKCNMKCLHCCNNCGPNGVHMPMDIVEQALAIARANDECVTIGGGEPSLHPHIGDIVYKTVCAVGHDNIFTVTNGTSWVYYSFFKNMPNKPYRVSLDQFHDHGLIDRRVWEAERRNLKDLHQLSLTGRAITKRQELLSWDVKFTNECVCHETIVTPHGWVLPCGCQAAKTKKFLLSQYNAVYNALGNFGGCYSRMVNAVEEAVEEGRADEIEEEVLELFPELRKKMVVSA